MLIQINNDLEKILARIASDKNINKDEMLEKILVDFISRYEQKNGPVLFLTGGRKRNKLSWDMYAIYKNMYFELFQQHYTTTPTQQSQDLKYIKDIQKKILISVSNKERINVISIKDDDMIGCFHYFLAKMPDWWKHNAFNLKVLNGKFDQILKSIEHGKQRGKNALDDFIINLSTGTSG